MTHYLIVVATQMEITPLLHALKKYLIQAPHPHSSLSNVVKPKIVSLFHYMTKHHKIDLLVTGAGLLHTCFHLTNCLNSRYYEEVIHVGIAGSYNTSIKIGELVYVPHQEIGDLGAENGDQFIPIKQMDFWDAQQFPYQNGILSNSSKIPWASVQMLPKVKGISVNRITGTAVTIQQMNYLYEPDIECMEGAAVFYCCLQQQQSFHEIRAISNYVTPRNKAGWNMTLAVERLNTFLIALLIK